jgi:hypothetical protein
MHYSYNHIYQQIHITGLQVIYVLKTPTHFGTEAPTSGSLKYNVVQAPTHQHRRYNRIIEANKMHYFSTLF